MDNKDILAQLQEQAEELKAKNTQLNTALGSSSYQGQEDGNLIQYQLDTGEMLGKIEHFLRGEYITTDKQGNEFWAKQENESLILFNDYGVNSIMSIIGNYIDKNTMLSFYDDMRINEILADLGDALSNFVFCNYDVMGMDTEFKKTRYPLVVITLLHAIESAYRRALRGKTSEDLNTSRIFTQSDIIGNRPMGQPTKKAFNLLKPGTW